MIAYIVGAFVAGVIVGALLDEAFEIVTTGKGRLVEIAKRGATRVTGSRSLGVVLVTASLAVNAFLGFSLIATQGDVETTTAQVARQGDRLVEVVDCQAVFNADKAEALKARDVVLQATTDEELNLWRNLRRVLSSTTAKRDDLLDAIDAYIVRIEEVQATRRENPYPDPATCRETLDR